MNLLGIPKDVLMNEIMIHLNIADTMRLSQTCTSFRTLTCRTRMFEQLLNTTRHILRSFDESILFHTMYRKVVIHYQPNHYYKGNVWNTHYISKNGGLIHIGIEMFDVGDDAWLVSYVRC